ncbi:very short patch repair endonuclease [Thalassospira sp.]|uniref:very short patch repair endonuclease n=1 Tax=Thalassospira sp. TaxID=1912094 RepID=UPI00311D4E86
MDIVDAKTRSRMMSGIRSRNTKPEVLLRKALHAMGYRYRLNVRLLPGSPDIVLPKWRVVIFVHGCFWHRHRDCKKATTPATNTDFWNKKFEANTRRDKTAIEELHKLGWRTAIVWECAIRSKVDVELIDDLASFISQTAEQHVELGAPQKGYTQR